MRPIGHKDVREAREYSTIPLDDRLTEAWEQYRLRDGGGYEMRLSYQERFSTLRDIRPSIKELHAFILRTYDTLAVEDRRLLGRFITAGYQCVPEQEIVYDLETPYLHMLGSYLHGKRLVIDGVVGDGVGSDMAGELVINGTAGGCAGDMMIGTFRIGPDARLLPRLSDDSNFYRFWTTQPNPGVYMIGTLEGGDADAGSFMVGKRNGVWNIHWRREEFLADIAKLAAKKHHPFDTWDALYTRHKVLLRRREHPLNAMMGILRSPIDRFFAKRFAGGTR